jgi:hypothetical protein
MTNHMVLHLLCLSLFFLAVMLRSLRFSKSRVSTNYSRSFCRVNDYQATSSDGHKQHCIYWLSRTGGGLSPGMNAEDSERAGQPTLLRFVISTYPHLQNCLHQTLLKIQENAKPILYIARPCHFSTLPTYPKHPLRPFTLAQAVSMSILDGYSRPRVRTTQ